MNLKTNKPSGTEALEILDLVIRLQNLNDVASLLNISTSTVNTIIRKLRKQFSDVLYTRRDNQYQPTSLAIMLLNKLESRRKNAPQENNELTEEDVEKNHFTIYCESHASTNVIPLIIQLNRDTLPIKHVTLPQAGEILVEQLLKQEIDVVFDYQPLVHPEIISRPLFKEEYCIICSKMHPRLKESVTVEEFYKEHHAVIDGYLSQGDIEFNEKIMKKMVSFLSNDILDLLSVVEVSEMVAIIPCDLYQKMQASFGIKSLNYKFNLMLDSQRLHINYRKNKKKNVPFGNILELVK